MNAADEAQILRQAIEIMRQRRGGLGTTIAVLEETAQMLETLDTFDSIVEDDEITS